MDGVGMWGYLGVVVGVGSVGMVGLVDGVGVLRGTFLLSPGGLEA